MKVRLPAGVLTGALKRVSGLVESRITIPILRNALITATQDHLTLRATDLDMDCTVTVPAIVEKAGSITVDAKVLETYAGKMAKGDDIKLELVDERLVCSQGRSRSQMLTLPARDYPDFASDDLPHNFNMDGKTFLEMLEGVRFAISSEETRYYLNGVYLHHARNDDRLRVVRVVSTDGHRLSMMQRPVAHGGEAPEFTPVIVARKTVLQLLRLLENAELVNIAISASQIRFTIGTTILVSKLIDGTYPDYERVIPRPKQFASMDAGHLAGIVDRVQTVAKEKGSAIRLELEGNNLKASVREADTGEALEDMDITFEGTPIRLGVNARYLKDCLGAIGSEQISLGVIDPGSPVLIQEPSDTDRLIVIMPMRA